MSMTALQKILAWSEDKKQCPTWMRDALRRVILQSDISDDDLNELSELCKKVYGLSESEAAVNPITVEELPSSEDGSAVTLVSLKHLSDVNALIPGETIKFGTSGLTVIYGNNGVGKSGYTRILKRACRARGSDDPILPNAISEKPAGTPMASIEIKVGDEQRACVWKDGSPSDTELGAVSVFDTSAAQVYVGEKTEVRFRPFGLDVPDRLASVCVDVKGRLEQEKRLLQSSPISLPEIPSDTVAGKLLSSLSALTKREEIDKVATLSPDEEAERTRLEGVLAAAKTEDPTKKATALKNGATRLRRLGNEVDSLLSVLGSQAAKELSSSRAEASDAARVAHKVSTEVAGVGLLAGLGEESWRSLWNTAEKFSKEHAYPHKDFPYLGEGAVCVLCQNSYSPDALKRMEKFRDFVQGEAQNNVVTKRAVVDAVTKKLSVIDPEKEANKDAIDDLRLYDANLATKVESFLKDAKTALDSFVDVTLVPNPITQKSLKEEIDRVADDLDTKASEIQRAATPVERLRMETRHKELQARHSLASGKEQVLAEVNRLARENAYERAIKDTDTRSLTTLSTQLTKEYVTDALTTAFARELQKLGFQTLEIELQPAGARQGVLYHQIRLKHATKAQLPRIVSEGESRCISLAAFLAEIDTSSSAIVFDDPVSSLDHIWRSRVAKRLVEESKRRQVIVFTHEMAFLAALLQEADDQSAEYTTQTLVRGAGTEAGRVEENLPFTGMSAERRVRDLKARWQDAEKIYRTQGPNEYEPVATRIYADLRKSWERAVEEVLLNGAVVRYEPGIQTNKLMKIGDITNDDLAAINAGMTKSSKWEGGHDHALALNEPVPTPDELKSDIEQLEQFIKEVKSRRPR